MPYRQTRKQNKKHRSSTPWSAIGWSPLCVRASRINLFGCTCTSNAARRIYISDAIQARPGHSYTCLLLLPSDSDQANPGHSSSSRWRRTLSSPPRDREADGTSCARNNAAPRLLSRGSNHGARRRAHPDDGVHPGGAVQHGRARRRHGGRQVGRLRATRVRPLATHAPPLPCPPVGGGPRAAARRRRRRQRAGRRPRHALRARRPPVQRPQEEEERRRGRAGAVRAGRHPHRQLDTGHGPLRPHAHPRQGRRHRKDRGHALVPGRDGHHQEGGRAGVRRAHGGHGPGRPAGPRHARPSRHPGWDRDGAGQVRGSGEEGAAGGEAAQPQVRGRQGSAHRQRLHAPHHPSSGPPRRHARRRIPSHAPPLITFYSMSETLVLNHKHICISLIDPTDGRLW